MERIQSEKFVCARVLVESYSHRRIPMHCTQAPTFFHTDDSSFFGHFTALSLNTHICLSIPAAGERSAQPSIHASDLMCAMGDPERPVSLGLNDPLAGTQPVAPAD